jgi:hypothetical protein
MKAEILITPKFQQKSEFFLVPGGNKTTYLEKYEVNVLIIMKLNSIRFDIVNQHSMLHDFISVHVGPAKTVVYI